MNFDNVAIDTLLALFGGLALSLIAQYILRRIGEKTRIKQLEAEVEDLRNKVLLLESGHQDAPIPIWLKDQFGIMLSLNPAYEQTFLIPRGYARSNYLHNPDTSVWPADIAEEFLRNDLMVFRTGIPWQGTETIIDHQGKRVQWRILKYPREVAGVRIGIAGMAWPQN